MFKFYSYYPFSDYVLLHTSYYLLFQAKCSTYYTGMQFCKQLWSFSHEDHGFKKKKPRLSTSYRVSLDDRMSVLAIVIHNFDKIQISVRPVDELLDQVQRHSGRLFGFILHYLGSVGAVHIAPFHLGYHPIVREKEFSGGGARTEQF